MSGSLSQPYTIPFFIKYNPVLRAEFGSQNAVLLFDRLEYWFSKKKNTFYKFIEPCAHPCYRQGDSWCEELGFSRPVFRTAFDKIGIRYISKTAFDTETDPFKGKLFAYYQDRKSNKTIFVRNNSLLKDLYHRLKNLLNKTITTVQPSIKKIVSPFQPRNDRINQPYVHATKDKQITTSFKKKETCFLVKEEAGQVRDNESQIASEMTAIWEEEIGKRGLIPLTSESNLTLEKALNDQFQGSLQKWRAHCVTIASSKFLMGEREGIDFDIKMRFALSAKFLTQIREGKYEINTRVSNHDQKIKERAGHVKQLALKKELVETQLGHLADDKKRLQKQVLAKTKQGLSPQERKQYKTAYEALMQTAPTGEGSRFRAHGWEDTQVQFMFDLFVDKELKNIYDLTVPMDLITKETGLQDQKNSLSLLYDKALKELKNFRTAISR